MTRRDMLKALGATAAFHTLVPSWSVHAASAPAGAVDNFTWFNKHLNLSAQVARHYDVWNRCGDATHAAAEPWRMGFDHLRTILADAQASGRRVRAVGSRWSLSPVAVCPDVMINTAPLNFHRVGLPAEHVSSTVVDPRHLVFAQCGASVLELSDTLERRGLSLPTSGASNGQTICGAISTGTHGSARRVGAMQDFMLGLHILAEDGRSYWIERASTPVVSDAFCEYLGATLVRDDQLFRAAVVSLGSFGVIHAVLFEAVPIYLLEVHRTRIDWADAARAAFTLDMSGLDLPYDEEPFHFDVALNPYLTGVGKRGAIVTAMYKRPYRDGAPRQAKAGKLVPGVDLLGIAGRLAEVAPATIPAAVGAIFDSILKAKTGPSIGTHGQVFDATELIGKSLSAEVGVDLQDTAAAVETLLGVIHDYPYPGMLGLRYVQRSDAQMAFTRFATTSTIEMTGPGSKRTNTFYERAWAALDAARIPYAQHWGKVNSTTCDNVRDRFGSGVDEWLAARRGFLSPAGRAMFANDLLTKCGLDR